ncbi:MAG: rhodanese-like protein [Clostridia bacterium]|jgi:rhodanese-related sulfurtransferase|nr:rhodanese-like protein [Clostridia bacterium]
MFNFRFNKNNILSNLSNSFRGNRSSRFVGEYKVVNQEELHNFLNQDVCVLDVRTESEFRSIRVKNAINIPLNILSREILSAVPNKETKILVYCVTGERTKVAIQKLNSLDYKNIYIWGNGGLNTLKYKDILEY